MGVALVPEAVPGKVEPMFTCSELFRFFTYMGVSGPSLLIESIDSMIKQNDGNDKDRISL